MCSFNRQDWVALLKLSLCRLPAHVVVPVVPTQAAVLHARPAADASRL
jgi:hypothetical protein